MFNKTIIQYFKEYSNNLHLSIHTYKHNAWVVLSNGWVYYYNHWKHFFADSKVSFEVSTMSKIYILKTFVTVTSCPFRIASFFLLQYRLVVRSKKFFVILHHLFMLISLCIRSNTIPCANKNIRMKSSFISL